MNLNDYNQIKEQEKNLQKAKDKFFRQYKVDNNSFKSQLYAIDDVNQLGLEIIPKKTNHQEPFYIVGDDIKTLYTLLSMLFNANEIKKEIKPFVGKFENNGGINALPITTKPDIKPKGQGK